MVIRKSGSSDRRIAMLILGICGPAASGKTTLATLLTSVGWQRTRFAAPIKAMIGTLLLTQGIDNNTVWRMLDGDLKENPTEFLNGRTPRHAMQTLGSEWRDLMDRNLWTEVWKRHLRGYGPEAKILVDDLRFLHEEKVIRELGGKIVRIVRPVRPHAALVPGGHISETELAQVSADATIINDSTPDAMLTALASIMEYWK